MSAMCIKSVLYNHTFQHTNIIQVCKIDEKQINKYGTSPMNLPQWQHTTVASHQGQGFIPWGTPYVFTFTNPCYSFLSYTILLACLTSKPPFLKQSFTISIHLFSGLSTDQLTTDTPTLILSFSIDQPPENAIINPFI